MIVIKLGGSLTQSGAVLACLDTIGKNYQGRAVVIVPGGGGFADQVRLSQQAWRFDDQTAHAMAILAMQQMALLFHSLKKQFMLVPSVAAIGQRLAETNIVIWSPDVAELDQAGIPASWDITSDSLAAWLANTLSAEALVLVKSAAIDMQLTWQELARQGIVDNAFEHFAAQAVFPITLINARQFNG
ncbi:MAG: uridylate kinase [Methylovulum sp.]|uniref:amino acid kinase family protein n=1 Tax=Methylovulum sp. TaxID=1916980 RepID=UPI00262C6030|nr:uridylate kinase [Methylovulum sp.]MDD2724067.1 uridylate kinase [Methylovulum sp.]MDD5123827.1 uridylate kinase [Methylovulum sp.]